MRQTSIQALLILLYAELFFICKRSHYIPHPLISLPSLFCIFFRFLFPGYIIYLFVRAMPNLLIESLLAIYF